MYPRELNNNATPDDKTDLSTRQKSKISKSGLNLCLGRISKYCGTSIFCATVANLFLGNPSRNEDTNNFRFINA